MVDLAFIVDSSGSIQEKDSANWGHVLNFIETIVSSYTIGSNDVKVGLVVYSNDGAVDFYLNDFNTRGEVIDAVLNLRYVGGTTNTADGLQLMNEEIFQERNGDRASVPNVAILITDGESNERMGDTIPQAIAAKSRGIRIISVGVTDSVNMQELEAIATSSGDVFLSDDFDQLKNNLNEILSVACVTPAPSERLNYINV